MYGIQGAIVTLALGTIKLIFYVPAIIGIAEVARAAGNLSSLASNPSN